MERRVLRGGGHFAVACSVAAELELRLAEFALSRHCGHRDRVLAIGQRAAATEGAVGTERDGPASNGHTRSRFGPAVDDEFGIDVQPESSRALLLRGRRTGYAPGFAAERCRESCLSNGEFPLAEATHEFRDLV